MPRGKGQLYHSGGSQRSRWSHPSIHILEIYLLSARERLNLDETGKGPPQLGAAEMLTRGLFRDEIIEVVPKDLVTILAAGRQQHEEQWEGGSNGETGQDD